MRTRFAARRLAGALACALACAALSACRSRAAGPDASTTPARRPAAAGEATVDDAGIRYRIFPDELAALRHALASEPRIVGVGEVHQSTDSTPVRSTAERFISMLDLVAPAASDLVVETWVQSGRCGATERAFARDVVASTRRPAATQDHVRAMLGEAQRRGVAPHVLTIDCHDYNRLTSDAGAVDLEGLALLLGRQLRQLTARLYAARAAPLDAAPARAIWVYGGALHNDVYPEEGLETMSYAAELTALAGGRYLELDLYVPEYIRGNPLDVQQPWYPLFERHAGPDRALLIERGPRSFILVFRTGDTRAAPAPDPRRGG